MIDRKTLFHLGTFALCLTGVAIIVALLGPPRHTKEEPGRLSNVIRYRVGDDGVVRLQNGRSGEWLTVDDFWERYPHNDHSSIRVIVEGKAWRVEDPDRGDWIGRDEFFDRFLQGKSFLRIPVVITFEQAKPCSN